MIECLRSHDTCQGAQLSDTDSSIYVHRKLVGKERITFIRQSGSYYVTAKVLDYTTNSLYIELSTGRLTFGRLVDPLNPSSESSLCHLRPDDQQKHPHPCIDSLLLGYCQIAPSSINLSEALSEGSMLCAQPAGMQ